MKSNINSYNSSDKDIDEKRKEYIKAQKKKISVALIVLIIFAILVFVWKAYDAKQQQQTQEKEAKSQQINQIQSQINNLNNDSSANLNTTDTIFDKQNKIVEAIKRSQPLPIKIDDITYIKDVFFKEDALVFSVEIDNERLKSDEQEKMKDKAAIEQILLRNKPVACNLMKNLLTWEGSWSISYQYYFRNPLEEIGSINFEPSGC